MPNNLCWGASTGDRNSQTNNWEFNALKLMRFEECTIKSWPRFVRRGGNGKMRSKNAGILMVGDVIRETYRVERLIGEGAFAEVYRVAHRFMGRQAMKVLKGAGATADDINRQIEEARLLSRLRHRNIIEVFDANILERDHGVFGYFTMTNMPGGSLERFWRAFGSELMPVDLAVNIMTQVARGLSVAHEAAPPIIHRDTKPQNILIGYDGDGVHVRISDFGLAKSVNPLTLFASARGTMGFKPPEALDGQDSCAADVWAMGTTLYLLLTDQMPYPALDDREVGDSTRFMRPLRPPSQFNALIDGGLESVIYKCLAADRQDRYTNASELLHDLERWTPAGASRQASISQASLGDKTAMVPRSRRDLGEEAQLALKEAMSVARNPNELTKAADLLEEALSKDPSLFDRYGDQLQLWRKGIMHVSTASFPKSHRASAPSKKNSASSATSRSVGSSTQ